jgi:pSer/pThr/pTyr-binding forkhead associated (FHA) protein
VATRPRLVLDDGQRLPDVPGLVLGRDPMADGHVAVPLRDEARALSKTHAALRHESRGWIVEDLHSTNGVAVRRRGELLLAEPGIPFDLHPGDQVLVGERTIEVVL